MKSERMGRCTDVRKTEKKLALHLEGWGRKSGKMRDSNVTTECGLALEVDKKINNGNERGRGFNSCAL